MWTGVGQKLCPVGQTGVFTSHVEGTKVSPFYPRTSYVFPSPQPLH